MNSILNTSVENDVLYQQRIRVRLNHNIITTVNAVQCDTAREFMFFFDDYEVPDGTELRIYIRKPSGREIYNYCAYINGDIIYQPTIQSLAEIGESLGQIQIIKNHVLLTSFSFRIIVEENLIASSNITSTDEFLILNELIETARIEIEKLIDLNELVTKQEEARVKAEQLREAAEAKRNESESTRKKNEEARKKAESDRETAESQRIEAETGRVNAEIEREKNSKVAVDNCNKAADRANDIVDNLQDTISNFIKDSEPSSNTTYSSNKIEKLLSDMFVASDTEPSNQPIGGIWLMTN